ncbi:MAG: hypothetical protein OCU18_06480 [Candidatus Syntrophoarchaeum sp.]|nr:hypothetical protein [Candidatus Syntrophoarchaeum sp.]
MTTKEKYCYIFEDTSFEGHPRVKWITDCLLGDIRTFLDGIENYTDNKEKFAGKPPRGGGNLAVPNLISTALEFVAALYAGKTKYMDKDNKDKKPVFSINKDLEREFENDKLVSENLKRVFEEEGYPLSEHAKFKAKNNKWKIIDDGGGIKERYYFEESNEKEGTLSVLISYDAKSNVKKFIEHFFPEVYKKIPTILWDGVRNGLVHTFYPKTFSLQGNKQNSDERLQFQFYVEDRNIPSHIKKRQNNTILISINVFELYRVLEKAIDDYLDKLRHDETLQDKFIRAWSSIEDYIDKADSNQSEETEKLRDYLGSNSAAPVLEGLKKVTPGI